MSLKKSILKNSIASLSGKVTMLIIRLLQVPIFLSSLGVTEYGHWLVISSLPSWLAVSSLGFGNVAANEITMSAASGDFKRASRIFSTTLCLIGVISLLGLTIVSIIIWLLPSTLFYSGTSRSLSEVKWAVVWLSLTVFISFSAEVFGGRLRAVNKAHQSMFLTAIRPWIEFFIFFVILQFTKRFDYLSLVSLFSIIIYIVVIAVISRGRITNIYFSLKEIYFHYIKDLFKKGMAFQAFPLGNALLFQGNILVIQSVLGPVAVVLFSTARTLVRSINQMMEMVNQVVAPEFSLLFGRKDFDKARRLHRISVLISITIALFCTILLSFIGIPLYKAWTGKSIVLSENLLLLFLLPIPFNAIWYTSSVLHAASNNHEGLAVRYLIACTISLLFCYFLSKFCGISGAAISTVFADLLLIPYVFSKSLALTGDTFFSYFSSIRSDIKHLFSLLRNRIYK